MRVLVVEDGELVRAILTDMLGDAGMHVTSTADPQDALALPAAAGPPTVLVTDVNLGAGMDGFDLAAAGPPSPSCSSAAGHRTCTSTVCIHRTVSCPSRSAVTSCFRRSKRLRPGLASHAHEERDRTSIRAPGQLSTGTMTGDLHIRTPLPRADPMEDIPLGGVSTKHALRDNPALLGKRLTTGG